MVWRSRSVVIWVLEVKACYLGIGEAPSNKSLQVTFDPPPIFAAAKTGVASNAPELRRYTFSTMR